ncbi:MAG: ABC-F family ATP-binding cassette domain-containing protein, partial [Cyanobacteria bacterium HKST-UBA02]|nr:ABC-F family ATP-binding cassette domain-containing protein [Cyanobacteria bacterium HKST-UBA02]
MLRIQSMTKYFRNKEIFKDCSLTINRGEIAGLVGANGSGKTTLLQIMAGNLPMEEGDLEAGGRRLYLSSFDPEQIEPDASLAQCLRPAWFQARKTMLEAASCLESDSCDRSALSRFQRSLENFEREGGYEIEADLEILLERLGLAGREIDSPLADLSGGESARLFLSAIESEDFDILLMDEPTNNLDEESIDWLADLIVSKVETAVIASHHRDFLDRLCNRTLVINERRKYVESYQGNYSFYKAARARQDEYNRRQLVVHRRKVTQLSEDVARAKEQARKTERQTTNDHLRRKSKKVAAKAKAREGRLEKMIARAESEEKPFVEKTRRFDLGYDEKARKLLVKGEGLSFSLAERQLFAGLDLEIHTGDRLAITGPVGAGKTTLIRILAGEIQPSRGSLSLPSPERTCYLPQTTDFDLEKKNHTVLEFMKLEIDKLKRCISESELRAHLDRFSMRGEIAHNYLSQLSRGERTKLCLALFIFLDPDLILLDEPTN